MISPAHDTEASAPSTLPHPPGIDPFATVAHLSIAPATTTTVVTTTTTTTTQFPPMYLRQPRSLRERDPKEYPLAHIPAPESIRKVLLDVGDQQLLFEEANDGAEALKEVCLRPNATPGLPFARGELPTTQRH